MKFESFCDRIDFILDRLHLIENIISNVKITEALNDEKILRPAILMHLLQIGETLNTIYKKNPDLIVEFDLSEEVKGAYNIRNFIAHDYEGVNLAIVESVIRESLPVLKNKIKKIKNEKC